MTQRFRLAVLRESFSYTPQTIKLAWKASPPLILLLAALTLANALTPLAIAYVGKLIIDGVVAADAVATPQLVALELVIVALQAFFSRSLGLMRQLLGGRLAVDINVMILEKAQTLELRHFENSEFYDQLT